MLDFEAAGGDLGNVDLDVRSGTGGGDGVVGGRSKRVGLGKPFEGVGGGVEIGVGIGGISGAEMGNLPISKGLPGGEVVGDPGAEQGDGLLVKESGGQGQI